MKTNDPEKPDSKHLQPAADAPELSNAELDCVSGGTGAKKKGDASQQEYLHVKFSDLLVSS